MNKNTEYEKLVQDIYQTIMNENSLNTIKVQHNVKIKGTAKRSHQIDVYFEFKVANEIFKTIIECKNYSKPVSIRAIMAFHALLMDIGDVKGIFVSKNGFQKGAIEYARQYNIILKELRHPNAKDWEGRVKTLIFNIIDHNIDIIKRDFDFDWGWMKERFGNKKFEMKTIACNKDVVIKNENGEMLTNLYELENKLQRFKEPVQGIKHSFPFNEAYVHFPNHERLKITAVKYEYNALVSSEEVRIDGDSLTKAIMIDVLSGERQLYKQELFNV